jgi:hypothetical protein
LGYRSEFAPAIPKALFPLLCPLHKILTTTYRAEVTG